MKNIKLTVDNRGGRFPEYERKILKIEINSDWYRDCVDKKGNVDFNKVLDYAENIE